MRFRLFLWLVLFAIVVLLVAQNAQVVELRFLVWRVALSQALLLFLVLVAGIGIGWTLNLFVGWRRARREPRRPDNYD